MKALKDFIIHLPKPNAEYIETQSGVKIFADRRFSIDRLSNREATVIEKPIKGSFEIEPGFQVLIDPTIIYEQHYHLTGGRQDSIFLVDKKKSLYKIDPSMIVCFRKNEDEPWQGFQDNGLYELVEEAKEKEPSLESAFIYIPPSATNKYKQDRAKVLFGNEEMLLNANQGDEVIVKPEMGINYWISGVNYKWFRNRDVIAVIQN